ncbi:MAG TPA: alpha/beta fold hydrolase [Pseudolabrys sp.]|jgi:pimeloyl-ACP methyl ester carboxylesterase|nr:alpha/beta fold hydrolase [Pseudolabrys sp.]
MATSLPLVLVPGLLCSARLYGPQIEELWRFGPITVADHRHDEEIGAVAKRILDQAPPRFALAGLSMGGYIAFAMLRLAPERILKLALLDTSARPDTPEQSAARYAFIEMAEAGRLPEVVETLGPRHLHLRNRKDARLLSIVRAMGEDTGVESFVRQEKAIISRPDSRPLLRDIRCPTLVLVGAQDEVTTPALAEEIAAGIAGAKLLVVPNCGHLSTIEQPEAVNAALAGWLNEAV